MKTTQAINAKRKRQRSTQEVLRSCQGQRELCPRLLYDSISIVGLGGRIMYDSRIGYLFSPKGQVVKKARPKSSKSDVTVG